MRGAALGALALALAGDVSAQLQPNERIEQGVLVRREGGLRFEARAGRLSVGLHDVGVDLAAALPALAAADPRLADVDVLRRNRLGVVDLAFPAERAWSAVIDALLATELFAFVEPNYTGGYSVTPNDPQFAFQWSLANTGQQGGTVGADVRAEAAWDLEDGDPSVVVAVLDSGTDWTHADLAASIWSNTDEVLNGVDDDGNGFVDDVRGWDFPGNDNDPSGLFNHGTSVASVIGARAGNGLDIAGLAGGAADGQGVSVMPLGVGVFSPDGSILDDALLYAVDNGAQVITMSLFLPQSAAIDAALQAAEAAGVFVDCATGNNGIGVTYPALRPEVMAIGSSNRFDQISFFSNQGPETELCAPGEDIVMLDIGSGVFTNSGTSFSAPHVAAAAALAFSLKPSVSAAQVRALLQETSKDLGVPAVAQGAGRLDVAAFLQAVAAITSAEVTAFGTGLAGTGGTLPEISARGGLPTLGNASFGLALDAAAPSSNAVLVASFAQLAAPFKGGTLYVNPLPPGKLVNTTTNVDGKALLATPLPNDPSLDGATIYAQWVVSDPGAPVGFALSNALELTLAE